jgi:large subunit ribosomal protein L4
MSKLKVYDMKGAAVGDHEMADSLLELGKGGQAAHDAVVAYRAGRRAGTASTLSKGEVAGSNAKPWRQKGTGRARAGYRQSPVWRGGAVAFGPRPRSYEKKVNRKAARLAFKRAFSERVAAGQVKVLDQFDLAEPKTKAFASVLKSLDVAGPVLFVVETIDKKLALASRNIPDVEVVRAKDVNVYQLARYPLIVVCREGLGTLEERLGAPKRQPDPPAGTDDPAAADPEATAEPEAATESAT